MNKNLLSIVLASSLALTLSGCGLVTVAESDHMNHGSMTPDATGDFSSVDLMFAQMMIPHHQQAVDMGTLAESRAANSEVKAISNQIKNEQAPEIIQMRSWLTKANVDLDDSHDMPMDGMLTPEQMQALTEASGAEFDRLYVEGMIAHHEGAIVMAQMVVSSSNTEVQALAESIIDQQNQQIIELKALLKEII